VAQKRNSGRPREGTPSVPLVEDEHPAPAADHFAVGLAQKRAQHELRLAIDAALAPLDVNTSQVWLLNTIERHPGASSVRLAHLVFLTPQSLGQQLQQMQKRGFIERLPGDRRRLRHYLTDEGKRMCDAGMERIRAVDEEVFRDFSEEELANLAAIYRLVETRATVARANAKRALLTHG
jgi:DNA-binding MarR family transcriptional regulator